MTVRVCLEVGGIAVLTVLALGGSEIAVWVLAAAALVGAAQRFVNERADRQRSRSRIRI